MSLKNLQFMHETCQNESALTSNQIKRGFVWLIESLQQMNNELKNKQVQIQIIQNIKKQSSEIEKQKKDGGKQLDETIERFTEKMNVIQTKIQKQRQIAHLHSQKIGQDLMKVIKSAQQMNVKDNFNKNIEIVGLKNKINNIELKCQQYDKKKEEKVQPDKKLEVLQNFELSLKKIKEQLKRLSNQSSFYVLIQQFTELKIQTQSIASYLQTITSINPLEKKKQEINQLEKKKQTINQLQKKKQTINPLDKKKQQTKNNTLTLNLKQIKIKELNYNQIAEQLRKSDKSVTNITIIQVP